MLTEQIGKKEALQASDAALTVVVAEDNEIQRIYLTRLLEVLGYNVVAVADGKEALARLQDTNAQILLSDLRMPRMNGIELTRNIRALNLTQYVHIIMVTGQDEDDVRTEALEAGVDDFLTKERSPATLKARIRVADRLVRHAEELARSNRRLQETHARLELELNAAADAQRNLLPPKRTHLMGFEIASTFRPSSFVSGDMFGCLQLDDNHLGFYAVDVSGHGVHAALLSVSINHLITPEFFRLLTLANPERPDPSALVEAMNERFSEYDNDDYFTMLCGIVNIQTGRLSYCQAAYPSPYYLAPDGQMFLVGDGGFPVGMLPGAVYDTATLTLAEGGCLVLHSDAATEAEHPGIGPFGSRRLKQAIAQAVPFGAASIPEKVQADLLSWRGGHDLEDDLTIVAIERRSQNDPCN